MMLITGSALLTGCQYSPYAHRYVTVKPQPTEIQGDYVLVERTIYDWNSQAPDWENRAHPLTIHLSDAGSYEVGEFPIWVEAAHEWRIAKQVTGTGSWTINVAGGLGNGWSEKDYFGVQFEGPVGDTAAIGKRSGRWQLIFIYGDPDTGRAMVFERVAKNRAG